VWSDMLNNLPKYPNPNPKNSDPNLNSNY
jgi:hypothetical protein